MTIAEGPGFTTRSPKTAYGPAESGFGSYRAARMLFHVDDTGFETMTPHRLDTLMTHPNHGDQTPA